MTIGSNIIYREKLSSTNDLAAELLRKKKASDGMIIHCSEQTAGRGQRGNKWMSQAGKNLIISIILFPSFLPAASQFQISKIISLSIIEFLGKYTVGLKIKWPNDIYHKDDKIAGILIENSIEGDKIRDCISGTGININQEEFPASLPNPVSLKSITGKDYIIGDMLDEFCIAADKWYGLLRKGSLSVIDKAYLEALYLYMEPADFISADGSIIKGRITGVDEYGQLRLQLTNGKTVTYSFSGIRFSR